MDSGELLTRLTIWIALAGYGIATAIVARARGRHARLSAARLIWTAGCLALALHFICALHYYHGWSHASVFRETARQTAEVFGLYWSGGVYINYLFLTAWAADAVFWWQRGLKGYERRPRWIAIALHAFMLFIIFNATVVFKAGLLRWIGAVSSVAIVLLLAFGARKGPAIEPS